MDLGRLGYADALAVQRAVQSEVIALRENETAASRSRPGRILLVEHDPVITVTARPRVRDHLLASPEVLRMHGVDVCETDRGGDITYHGPGQLVAYPILDLNALNLGLHEYMSTLEAAVIDTCAALGVAGHRDPAARGVWVRSEDAGTSAKVCAMGVRVRRWVSMHGLALNVRPNLDHFAMIVPCGLVGRPVTSLFALLGERCPSMGEVKRELAERLIAHVETARDRAMARRGEGAMGSPLSADLK